MAPTPETVVRQWFKEVWDEGHEEAIDRLALPDLIAHGLGGPNAPPLRGTAEFKNLFHVFREALGDLEIAVERVITEGDTCAACCRVRSASSARLESSCSAFTNRSCPSRERFMPVT